MDFFTVVDTQRALRRFRPDPVPDAALERMLAAATRAPSARGAEPWYFVVIRDPALRAAIGADYRRAWEAALATTAAADTDRDVRDRPLYARMMLRSPVAAYASIFPAVQNLCLAARALGLGTTLTTLHTAFAPALAARLGIPASVEVVALVPVGYPRDRFGPTRRKPVEEVTFLDRWGVPWRRAPRS